ncbi:H-NS histone family protein [uncultured Tateyamaria sp.]|uniref:H-NS histone family protein n=1 Tax=uncultured Tateyamaria sp. TaxID=455651 RepID=UPI0026148B36|nr:H-NS histone family protein [uncultured Tateyamaria sp.]
MAKINLEKMSLKELSQLRSDVGAAIIVARKTERKDALAAAQKAAAEFGFTLAELMDGSKKPKRVGAPSQPKYQHPENPSVTWTGKGRQPGWIKDGLASGKALKDYLIK